MCSMFSNDNLEQESVQPVGNSHPASCLSHFHCNIDTAIHTLPVLFFEKKIEKTETNTQKEDRK